MTRLFSCGTFTLVGALALLASCSVVNAPSDTGPGAGSGTGGQGGNATNRAPTFDNLPNSVTALVGATGHFTVQATDPDGDSLTFGIASNTCSFAVAMDGTSGEVTFTCPSTAEDCAAQVQVSDDGAPPASAEGTLHVSCTASGPAFTTNPPATAQELVEYLYTLNCTDADGDSATLSVDPADTCGGVLDDQGGGNGTYRFTPTEQQGGTSCTLALGCAAGADSVTQNTTVTIEEVNQAPVITNLPADVSGFTGTPAGFQVTATDADLPANALTFSLASDTCSFAVSVDAAGAVSFTCGASETCTATVKVQDDGVPASSATGILTIECSNTVNCAAAGLQSLVIGGVLFCYTNQPGTCQDAHVRCEGLGQSYRLMCGDDWQPGRTGEGCGNAGAYTAYDLVNQQFPGSQAIGGYSAGQYDCVSGGAGMSCVSDSGNGPASIMNGSYAFCSPKNYFTAAVDGPAFAQVCGN
jgi:hypothetical protein